MLIQLKVYILHNKIVYYYFIYVLNIVMYIKNKDLRRLCSFKTVVKMRKIINLIYELK